MKRLTIALVCLAILTGCASREMSASAVYSEAQPQEAASPAQGSAAPAPLSEEDPPAYETVSTLSLSDLEPLQSWDDPEPEAVSADTMGKVLCDERLPDGTNIVCYWEPDSQFVKYWAIRQGDTLLRFCEEYSAYSEGYDVEPFTNVLGHDGFRITALRGAAYMALDYYILDENGYPHLLAGCANDVIETDVNGDGQQELLWFYHSGREIYYVSLQDGAVTEWCLSDLFLYQEESWMITSPSMSLEDSFLPVRAYQDGVSSIEAGTLTYYPGRLRFDGNTITLEILWSEPTVMNIN